MKMICAWCKHVINKPVQAQRVTRFGKVEYFHYHIGKDCLRDKIEALATVRDARGEDEFYDDDEIESIKFETDLVPFKPHTDIVLVGKAYAPRGKPATHLSVSLQVGPIAKSLSIFGNRFWIFPSRSFAVIFF